MVKKLMEQLRKKGYIRILEAAIAILILLSFVYFITLPTYVKKTPFEEEVYKTLDSILDEIEINTVYRAAVLKSEATTPSLSGFIKDRLENKHLDGIFVICNIDESCIPTIQTQINAIPKNKDVFVRERVITTTLKVPETEPAPEGGATVPPLPPPKKIAIYAWTTF